MKRLRKRFGPNIRYYHCGEYGEKLKRPHYHALLFGFDFPDKKPWRLIKGKLYYRSDALEQLWPFGFSSIGEANFQTAAYVARYVTKKIYGPKAREHYSRVDRVTGEITELVPEYTTMSRRPGIGYLFYEKYHSDIYPNDFVVLRGRQMQPPRFYDKLYEQTSPEQYRQIKEKRKAKALEKIAANLTKDIDKRDPTLFTKERVATLNLLNTDKHRSYENED